MIERNEEKPAVIGPRKPGKAQRLACRLYSWHNSPFLIVISLRLRAAQLRCSRYREG
jgi:hypothetical protein